MHLNLVICSTRWRPSLHRAGDAVFTPRAQMTSPLSTCRKPARSRDPKQGPNWHHTQDQGPAPCSWGWGKKQRGAGALNITSSSSFFFFDFFLNFLIFYAKASPLAPEKQEPAQKAWCSLVETPAGSRAPPRATLCLPLSFLAACEFPLLHRTPRSTRSWKKTKNLTLEMKRKMHSLKKQKLSERIPVQGKKILFLNCLRGMISSLLSIWRYFALQCDFYGNFLVWLTENSIILSPSF